MDADVRGLKQRRSWALSGLCSTTQTLAGGIIGGDARSEQQGQVEGEAAHALGSTATAMTQDVLHRPGQALKGLWHVHSVPHSTHHAPKRTPCVPRENAPHTPKRTRTTSCSASPSCPSVRVVFLKGTPHTSHTSHLMSHILYIYISYTCIHIYILYIYTYTSHLMSHSFSPGMAWVGKAGVSRAGRQSTWATSTSPCVRHVMMGQLPHTKWRGRQSTWATSTSPRVRHVMTRQLPHTGWRGRQSTWATHPCTRLGMRQ